MSDDGEHVVWLEPEVLPVSIENLLGVFIDGRFYPATDEVPEARLTWDPSGIITIDPTQEDERT
jgi:hypothetical protein